MGLLHTTVHSLRSEPDGLGQTEHSGRGSFGIRVPVGRGDGDDRAAEKDGGRERLRDVRLLEQRRKLLGRRDERLQSGGEKIKSLPNIKALKVDWGGYQCFNTECVLWSAGCNEFLLASLQLWDVQSQKRLRSMDGHRARVSCLNWNDHVLSRYV